MDYITRECVLCYEPINAENLDSKQLQIQVGNETMRPGKCAAPIRNHQDNRSAPPESK